MSEISFQSEALVPTGFGDFRVLAFAKNQNEPMPHVAIVSPNIDNNKTVLLRIHSECMTGDVFGSNKCDCGEQLDFSLNEINKHNGIVIYLRQEGRGIGLIEKLKAYKLQEEGLDTVDANLVLGHQADSRDYDDAVAILKYLDIHTVNILTNNPEKLNFLIANGIKVESRIPIVIPTKEENKAYFDAKEKRMGHLF